MTSVIVLLQSQQKCSLCQSQCHNEDKIMARLVLIILSQQQTSLFLKRVKKSSLCYFIINSKCRISNFKHQFFALIVKQSSFSLIRDNMKNVSMMIYHCCSEVSVVAKSQQQYINKDETEVKFWVMHAEPDLIAFKSVFSHQDIVVDSAMM